MISSKTNIAVLGLGYVGLPLAVEFGKIFNTVGFDINESRIKELLTGNDSTLEVEPHELKKLTKLSYTSDINDIQHCNIFIVTVPTPIDEDNKPNLIPLIKATEAIGKILKKDDIVIYESTVFPGATEEICVPILENFSGLNFNQDFYCGYSPERINPGDKEHRLISIKKVTSGSTPEIAIIVDNLYSKIIVAGTYMAENIKVAEAAKVIENTQRDLNIALINELSHIFNKLNIDTEAVLKAAATKWNFLSFKPGLVGGHCIGVDPYYFTSKAIEVGYMPEVILSGRRLNDNMGFFVVDQVVNIMTKKNIKLVDSNILIMGLTFKENCPDLRNTRVIDIVENFNQLDCNVDVYDPRANKAEAKSIYNIALINKPVKNRYDSIIIAVAHDEFKQFPIEKIRSFGKDTHVIYDIKYIFNKDQVDGRL